MVCAAILLVTVSLIALPASGIAANCSYIGAWYGYTPDLDGNDTTIEWIINVQGQSQSSGTANIEDILFDTTLNNAFPDADRVTTLRGVWERTGGNTFNITMIGYAIDSIVGAPLWLGKMSGEVTLVDNCNTEELNLTFEFFAPDQDPFSGEPPDYGWIPLQFHNGHRMRVDPSPTP
jgi:hypothetical protein